MTHKSREAIDQQHEATIGELLEEILTLQQYITNLLYAGRNEESRVSDEEFDKWAEDKSAEIGEYYKQRFGILPRPLPSAKSAEEILEETMRCTIEEEADLDDPNNFYYNHPDVIRAMHKYAAIQNQLQTNAKTTGEELKTKMDQEYSFETGV
jgi:hypothetical protein